MSEQTSAMTKQGLDQHALLHTHWPNNCCLCARETDLAALRAENERFRGEIETEQEGREQIREMALAEIARKDARIAQLKAALGDARYLLENHASEKHVLERIAAVLKGDAFRRRMSTYAALKGDTSEIRRRASPDDKHPEDRIVH